MSVFVVLAGLLTNIQSSSAQTSPPQILAIGISAITSNSATVSYTTSTATTARVVYDTSAHAQAADYASATDFTGIAATSNQVFLVGIPLASTTYHYRLEVKDANGTTLSADRTFATISATGGTNGGTSLLITGISYSCVGAQCRIAYSTNVNATVQIRWDTVFQGTFGAYPNSSAETTSANGPRSLLVPPAGGTALQLNTTYHYRIQATGSGAPDITNDLTFQTGASGSDHTFSTGTCPDGTVIGACNANRQFCASGGNLVTSCTSICGLTCGTGQTCNISGQCVADPSLNGSPYQCDATTCFDGSGQLINPAPAGCYSSWPKCDANSVLKVQKDRGCNLWLTCATSLQTEPTPTAPAENLCLSLAACNSLGLEGQCNKYLPQGQCSNDPLRFCATDLDCTAGGTCNTSTSDQPTKSLQNVTFQTPEDVSKIADLSGNVVAGLDWHQQGGSNVISGMLPWQLMRQVGGNVLLQNGDFEYNPPDATPWAPAPPAPANHGNTAIKVDFEDRDNSINHVLVVDPDISADLTTKHCVISGKDCAATDTVCNGAGDRCAADTAPIKFSGVVSQTFTTTPSEFYYAEARIKAPTGNPHIRFQFGFNNYTTFAVGTTPTYVDVNVTNAWQRITLGPIQGMSGQTNLAAVCVDADATTCSEFWLDDVQVRPVLQTDTNPTYITPSCRLYAKDDSPACDYVDQNNVVYKGWHGYCLEHDSQTGTCLSWWPVDIIKGESNVFGSDQTAGYQDRAPLYMCADAAGNDKGNAFTVQSYTVASRYNTEAKTPSCNSGGSFAPGPGVFSSLSYTIGMTGDRNHLFDFGATCNQPATQADSTVREEDITSVDWSSIWYPAQNASWTFTNDTAFQNSSFDNYYHTAAGDDIAAAHPGTNETGCSDAFNGSDPARVCDRIYRDAWDSPTHDLGIDPNRLYNIWTYNDNICVSGDLNVNCIFGKMFFDKTTHKLVNYSLFWDPRETRTEGSIGGYMAGAFYQVIIHTKETCNTLVQVVDPAGNNQAFASRVNSSSYTVPDLNYGQSKDVVPFGGAIGPATGTQTPDSWGLLSVESPNYTSLPGAGQARAGSVYACNGPCAKLVCTTDPTNNCATAAQVQSCQAPDPGTHPNQAPGDCTGAGTNFPGSNLGVAQLFGVHDPTAVDPTVAANKPYYAQERLSRIFAKSFGIYTYDTTTSTYKLQSNPGYAGPTTICPTQNVPGQCSAVTKVCSGTAPITATGTSQAAATASAVAACQAKVACDGTKAACPASGTVAKYTGATVTCTGAGTNWSCSGSCTLAAATTFQQATTVTQAGGPKPVRPAYPNDFCSVPPSVTGAAFLNATATVTTITSGSGSVGIKFNTNADADQVPLSIIGISWGDNSNDSFSYPFAPRNDPAKPHIFSHAYVYDNGSSAACTNVACTSKTFHIKIQVKDNWGWCSDVKTDATTVNNCSPNVANWYDTGLTVNISR